MAWNRSDLIPWLICKRIGRGGRTSAGIAATLVAALSVPLIVPTAHAATLRHMLWDSAQKPIYQQCADDFQRRHPGTRIRLQQLGWDDYWGALSTGFVADSAPDVFTNHTIKFAEQVINGVLLDIAPLIARERVRTDVYEDALLANWSRGAAQYALPADWDTLALLVNLDMARRAGITEAELRNMNWNPSDGGSFGRIAARLTRDKSGRDALDAAFDKAQVQTVGYQTPGPGGMFGQSEWSHFAVSNGFSYQGAPWHGPLRYDDPALAQTLQWLTGLSQRGVSATPSAMGKIGADAMFVAGRVAMLPTGSWMLGHFTRNARFAHAFVPLPIGPSGQRASMRNGLAHSIWRGTKHPAEAWAWLRYLGSPDCQAVVATHGVVYPAVRGLSAVAAQAQRRLGADPSAFLQAAAGPTFAPPIVDHSAQINDIFELAIDRILRGRVPAAQALREANGQANALLGFAPAAAHQHAPARTHNQSALKDRP